MKILLTALLALVLHLTLGWAWTALAGAVSGWWALRRGWLAGATAVGLAWLGLTIWNYAVAPYEVLAMWRTVGAFAGGAPPWVVPIVTVTVGILLGAAGGWLGASVGSLYQRPQAGT